MSTIWSRDQGINMHTDALFWNHFQFAAAM